MQSGNYGFSISFIFAGWIDRYKPSTVYDAETLEQISIPSDITKEEFLSKLKNGSWLLSFKDAVENCDVNFTEFGDYEIQEP